MFIYIRHDGLVQLFESNADRLRKYRLVFGVVFLTCAILIMLVGWSNKHPLVLSIYGVASICTLSLLVPLVYSERESGVSFYRRQNDVNRAYIYLVSLLMYISSILAPGGLIAWAASFA